MTTRRSLLDFSVDLVSSSFKTASNSNQKGWGRLYNYSNHVYKYFYDEQLRDLINPLIAHSPSLTSIYKNIHTLEETTDVITSEDPINIKNRIEFLSKDCFEQNLSDSITPISLSSFSKSAEIYNDSTYRCVTGDTGSNFLLRSI